MSAPVPASVGSLTPCSAAFTRIAAASVLHDTSDGRVGGSSPDATAPVVPPTAITDRKITIILRTSCSFSLAAEVPLRADPWATCECERSVGLERSPRLVGIAALVGGVDGQVGGTGADRGVAADGVPLVI